MRGSQKYFHRWTATASLAIAILLAAPSDATASDRYIRYKLLAPKVDSIARMRFITHITDGMIHVSWNGWKLKGALSRFGLYTPPGEWSEWYKFPDSKAWGALYLDITTPEKIRGVKVAAQIATYPDDAAVVKTLEIENKTGNLVGFVLPLNILATPELIQSVAEVYAARRAVAESVALKKSKRPKLITFTPSGVATSPTIENSPRGDLEIIRMLGFNTLSMDHPASSLNFPFRIAHNTGNSLERDKKQLEKYKKQNPERRPPIIYSILRDEPGWRTGFDPIWRKSGEKGFRDYLRKNRVNPKIFGVDSLGKVRHINRANPVAADAPAARRRLWYWSCRYTYYAGAVYFRHASELSRETFPDTDTTVNFPDHSILMNNGMIAGYGPDYFEYGRQDALSMYWTEDWLFPKLRNWGNGLYQKIPFLAELLRSAARYHHGKNPKLGFHIINVGYAPSAKGIDRSNALRMVMLLGRGVKNFSFFRYGPTHRSTVDFWSDKAPVMRGIADAINLVGGDDIEPYVHAGQPVPAETCMIYGTTSEYWQNQNKNNADNPEKQWLYCMLTQHQIPLEIIDSFDLGKFIDSYKAAYFVDANIRKASAAKLMNWMKKGGVLTLWPKAATLDEYNEPLKIFKPKTGAYRVGRGWIVRLKERLAQKWWENTKKLCAEAKSDWPSRFDFKTSAKLAEPALKLARISRPVQLDFPGIVADALVSEKGVAVTLANLAGTFNKDGVRYLNLGVHLRVDDAKQIKSACSSRVGKLPLLKEKGGVSVTLPLDSTDIVVFSKK